MGESGLEDRVGRFRGGLADLPDANSIIDTAGHQPFAVRTERDGVLLLERLRKRVAPFAGRQVPELDCAVRAGARENFAVGPEHETEHRAVVARKSFDFIARFNVPEFDLLIVAAGRQRFAVRRNRHRVDRVLVPLKHMSQSAPGQGPLPHFAQPAGLATGSEQEVAVG